MKAYDIIQILGAKSFHLHTYSNKYYKTEVIQSRSRKFIEQDKQKKALKGNVSCKKSEILSGSNKQ